MKMTLTIIFHFLLCIYAWRLSYVWWRVHHYIRKFRTICGKFRKKCGEKKKFGWIFEQFVPGPIGHTHTPFLALCNLITLIKFYMHVPTSIFLCSCTYRLSTIFCPSNSQGIGDSAQGLANAILFLLLTKTYRSWIVQALARFYKPCGAQYNEIV